MVTPRCLANACDFASAVGEKSMARTSRPCSARNTPLRPSPSAMDSAFWPGFSRPALLLRNAFGSVPK
jgi:hypothetical protein